MMTERGGRDTEKDLLGNKGGYETVMNNAKSGTPCAVCGYEIVKENYLGGKIYFCVDCQKF
jgi:formamidopyrimidine-DNA glycosylase